MAPTSQEIRRLISLPVGSRSFRAALVAALPVWVALWWLNPPNTPLQYSSFHLVSFLVVTVAYPVLEEIVFRGAIQGYLMDRVKYRLAGPVSPANILTSAAFAILHGIIWGNLWSLLVFFPSLIYGYFREKTGGLTASIFLHAFYNAGFFLVTFR